MAAKYALSTRWTALNALGTSDMAGNVWEMTTSPMQPYPYTEADDLEARDGEALWVMRGGSFADGLGNIELQSRWRRPWCAQRCHRISARHQRPPSGRNPYPVNRSLRRSKLIGVGRRPPRETFTRSGPLRRHIRRPLAEQKMR